MRKLVLLALAVLTLAGCGFKLRGMMDVPFDTIYINGSGAPAVKVALENAIRTGTKAQLATSPEKAQVVLTLLMESREKRILSLGGTGRVREYQLVYHLGFSATYNGKPSIPPQQIELRRDMTYDDAQALAKEQEAALLYKSMQDDAVIQLLRRLKGATAPQAKAAPLIRA